VVTRLIRIRKDQVLKCGRSLDIQPKVLCSSTVCARQPQITLPPFTLSYFPNLYSFVFLPGDTVYSGLLSASLNKSQINEILRRPTEIFFRLHTWTVYVTLTLARCANVTRLLYQTVPVFTRNYTGGSKDFSYMRSIDLCNNMRQVKLLSHHDKEGGDWGGG